MSNDNRQPSGSRAGGQWKAKARGESERDLFAPHPEFNSINDSFPMPQANKLEHIVSVIHAVEGGAQDGESIAHSLNMDAREGNYYADAAGYLGLLEAEGTPRRYVVSDVGELMLAQQEADQHSFVANTAANAPAVKALAEGDEDAAFDMHVARGYSDATSQRRVACAESWLQQIRNPEFEVQSQVLLDEAGKRIPQAADTCRERAKKREAEQAAKRAPRVSETLCRSCFMNYPAHLNECPNCG